jgi:hypothetical protein
MAATLPARACSLKRSSTSSAVAIWRLVDQGPDERRPRHGATRVIEAGQLVVADQEASLMLALIHLGSRSDEPRRRFDSVAEVVAGLQSIAESASRVDVTDAEALEQLGDRAAAAGVALRTSPRVARGARRGNRRVGADRHHGDRDDGAGRRLRLVRMLFVIGSPFVVLKPDARRLDEIGCANQRPLGETTAAFGVAVLTPRCWPTQALPSRAGGAVILLATSWISACFNARQRAGMAPAGESIGRCMPWQAGFERGSDPHGRLRPSPSLR